MKHSDDFYWESFLDEGMKEFERPNSRVVLNCFDLQERFMFMFLCMHHGLLMTSFFILQNMAWWLKKQG